MLVSVLSVSLATILSILFYTDLTGALLTSATAGGASGSFLQITINGTAYKIALLNP